MGARSARTDSAYVAFVRQQRPALVAFAWTLIGDLGAAEDVAQDALHATWQAWDRGGARGRRRDADRGGAG